MRMTEDYIEAIYFPAVAHAGKQFMSTGKLSEVTHLPDVLYVCSTLLCMIIPT
jgi:hypothetical protein